MTLSDNPNPKDLIGATKLDLSLFPPAGLIHGAHAFVDGAAKYGPYNWREHKVLAMVYVAAIKRHLEDWVDGQDTAPDSECEHLGHLIASAAILLDAKETGNMIDNRPPPGKAFEIMARIEALLKRRKEAKNVEAKAAADADIDALARSAPYHAHDQSSRERDAL